MAVTQLGKAVVWGNNGIACTAGIVSGTNAAYFQNASYSKDGEVAYIKNDSGETVGRVDYDLKATLTLTVIPYHATLESSAKTSLDAWMPARGTVVTLTDADGDIETINSGKYVVNRATQNRTNTGPVTVDLELEAFVGNDITTSITEE